MEKEKHILDTIDKSQNPFKVPENYFMDFANNLDKEVDLIEMKRTKTTTFIAKFKPWLCAAAAFLLLAICIKGIIAESYDFAFTSESTN